MKLRNLTVALLFFLPVPAMAQETTQAIPESIDILVLPPNSPPDAAPVATRNTPISAGSTQCNILTLPPAAPTPLINPTKVYFDDPFAGHAGRYCMAYLPTGIPNGTGYTAVGVFKAPTCTINGSTVSPCPSPRSAMGVPPFNIQPVLGQPATPTGVVIRP